MSWALNKRLSALKAYVPGEQPEPGKYIKLNTNEFPYPPSPAVAEETANSVLNMNLYSDLNCTKLKANFEKVFGFGGENVIFTNGSDEALYLCFLAFCGPDKGVAFADLTYGFYSVYADLCGLEKTVLPLDSDFKLIPEDYYNCGKTVFIANPNAPTGLKLTVEEIEGILNNNKNDVVVIDEAYVDFSDGSCAKLTEKYNNLVVVGTFSKSRGMAGARLGYIITNSDLVKDIETVKYSINPYNVNSLTQATGAAVLENDEYYKDCIAEICETRDDFTKNLKKIDFEVIPSQTNFVFAKHNEISGKDIANKLREKGILIRHFDKERIADYVRITIGTPDQMERVYIALEEIIGGK
ncbi:MAG: histidinol-phosphate transaminase [Ruminococcaceae bacterium]|nr:histidinol-phosphate transaminase [Oscillospiraceae bacterium]